MTITTECVSLAATSYYYVYTVHSKFFPLKVAKIYPMWLIIDGVNVKIIIHAFMYTHVYMQLTQKSK